MQLSSATAYPSNMYTASSPPIAQSSHSLTPAHNRQALTPISFGVEDWFITDIVSLWPPHLSFLSIHFGLVIQWGYSKRNRSILPHY